MTAFTVELAAILIECFLFTRLFVKYFGYRSEAHTSLKTVVLFSALVGMDALETFVLHTGVFVELWYLAIVFTFSVLFLRGSPGEQFIMIFVSYALLYIASESVYFLIRLLPLPPDAQDGNLLLRVLLILLAKSIQFLFYELFLHVHKNREMHFNRQEWSITVISIAVTLFMDMAAHSVLQSEQKSAFLIVLMPVSSCVMTIFLLLFMQKLHNARLHEMEGEMLALQLQMQQKELSQLGAQYQELSILRHDYKNQILCIQELLEENDLPKAKDYVSQLTREKFGSISTHIECSSAVVKAVVNVKISEAAQHRIPVSCRITVPIPENMEYDISMILSNLFDNAIEASQHTDEPNIILSISAVGGYLYLVMKNTIREPVLTDNSRPETTKADRTLHGWGLKSVSGIARRHGGELSVHAENGQFVAEVSLAIS